MSHSSLHCPIVGHIAENCTSEQRLCYNCRQPGHESAACPSPRTAAAKQCYSCGGVGHIQAECPSLRVQGASAGQKCYVSCQMCFCELAYDSCWSDTTELWPVWSHRSQLPKCQWLCIPGTSTWTFAEHVHTASCQMLSLRRTKPYGQVSIHMDPAVCNVSSDLQGLSRCSRYHSC